MSTTSYRAMPCRRLRPPRRRVTAIRKRKENKLKEGEGGGGSSSSSSQESKQSVTDPPTVQVVALNGGATWAQLSAHRVTECVLK